MHLTVNAQNTKLSPKFLVEKLYGDSQFLQSFGQITWKPEEIVRFHKISTPQN